MFDYLFQVPKIVFWPIVSSIYDFEAPFWTNYKIVLKSCKFPGLSFPCFAFNSRNSQIMLTKYPKHVEND